MSIGLPTLVSPRTQLLTPGVPCISPRTSQPSAGYLSARGAEPSNLNAAWEGFSIRPPRGDEILPPSEQDYSDHRGSGQASAAAARWSRELGPLLQTKLKDLRTAFRKIDHCKDHYIDEAEMIHAFHQLHLPVKDAKSLFREMDKEGTGKVTWEQFQSNFGRCIAGSFGPEKNHWRTESNKVGTLVNNNVTIKPYDSFTGGERQHRKTHVHGYTQYFVPSKGSKHQMDPYAKLHTAEGVQNKMQDKFSGVCQAFRDIDEDKSGSLDRDEMKRLFNQFHLPLTALDKVFSKADKDGGGSINFAEFKEHFGPIITPFVGSTQASYHRINDYGPRFNVVNNQYEQVANSTRPREEFKYDQDKYEPWMKKEDPRWVTRLQLGSPRGPRSKSERPALGAEPHPERTRLAATKPIPRGTLDRAGDHWSSTHFNHPEVYEADPEFTSTGRMMLDHPNTRHRAVMCRDKSINCKHLEHVCERKLHHGRMKHGSSSSSWHYEGPKHHRQYETAPRAQGIPGRN